MKILVTGAWKYSREALDRIEKLGHGVVIHQNEPDALPVPYDAIEGVVCNGLFLSHPIEKFTKLRYVQLTSAGLDRVPVDYINEHGIKLNNARGVYSVPMAEYAVSGVLSLCKKTGNFIENQKRHVWKKRRDLVELFGKTVCIMGCGSVGTECAKRFSAFGCRIYGVDDFVSANGQPYFEKIYTTCNVKEVLAVSDVVVLCLPLTKETEHFFNRDLFGVMKQDAILVNIARGALVCEDDLVYALENGLGGAVIDVFEQEPLGESKLWDMENVILTPHNSFVGNGNAQRLSDLIIKNLADYRQ